MKIQVNIEKKYAFVIIAVFLVLAVSIGVIAYGTNNPETFGHSSTEINFNVVAHEEKCLTTEGVCDKSVPIGEPGDYDFCAISRIVGYGLGTESASCHVFKATANNPNYEEGQWILNVFDNNPSRTSNVICKVYCIK